ncbi:MAG: hypothetical protein AAF562_00180 [Pseudomonadota bacterium]
MKPTQRVLILAFANSVGFSATTAMSLWITSVDQILSTPSWWGSVVGSAQLGAAALANFVAPYVLRNLTCEQLVRVAAALASISGAIMALSSDANLFAAAAIGLGLSLGFVLSGANALLARAHSVQGAYATAQICEVAFAACFYLLSGILIGSFGLWSLFALLSLLGLAVTVAAHFLAMQEQSPREAPGTQPLGYFDWRMPAAAVAFVVFFIGQSSFLQHQVAIGSLVGIEHVAMTRVMAIAMIGGFLGAVASKVVGLRAGLVAPVLFTTFALSLVLVTGPVTDNKIVFALCVVFTQAFTMATVPYFFTLLSKLDPTGRFPSRGPALLLIGVAGGPLVAELFLNLGGYPLGGFAGAILVLFSGGVFFLTARSSGKMTKREAADFAAPRR